MRLRVGKNAHEMQGRKFHLTVGGDNKHKISQEQFLKGTQINNTAKLILVRIDMCTQHVYIAWRPYLNMSSVHMVHQAVIL